MNNTISNLENVDISVNDSDELVNKIADILMQLSDEAKLEFYEFIAWIKENNPNNEEIHADLERRMTNASIAG